MSRRFRYKIQVHLALVFVAVTMVYFAAGSLKTIPDMATVVIYACCFIVFIAAIIDSIFTFYDVGDEGLALRSLLKSTYIKWDQVAEIKKLSGGSLVTETVGICSDRDKIAVSRWTKGYGELLSLILDNCRSREDVQIDFRVLNIINKCGK